MTTTRRSLAVLTATLLAAPLVAATPANAGTDVPARNAASSLSSVHATAVTVRSGFDGPTQVTSAPEGRSRLYVVQQPGIVTAVTDTRTWTYLDIRRHVRSGGEQGMLGLAFSPRFAKDRRLYVTYTRGDGALVLARLKAKRATAKHVRAATRRTLLVVKHPKYTNHNGGSMAFGPDGYLYLGTGDGGGGGNPFNTAGRLSQLRGKILRLDVSHACGHRRYCIPKSNPFRGRAHAKPQILHRGLRNPWRISFDPSGRLWIGDVGQNAYEEIDVLPRGARGLDLGWSCREGKHGYDPSACRTGAHYTEPVIELAHDGGPASMRASSITGGFVYRGDDYASLVGGAYVFGDWVTGNLWAYRGGNLANIGSLSQVTSFGENDDGELYAVTSGGDLVRLRFT